MFLISDLMNLIVFLNRYLASPVLYAIPAPLAIPALLAIPAPLAIPAILEILVSLLA